MEKEFVPYEQALALKELGFDELSLGRFYTKSKSKMFGLDEKGRHYPIRNTSKKLYKLGEHFVLNGDNAITAPLYQQAFRWFREKYDLFISIVHYENGYAINDLRRFETYEEAELACLKKLIEIVKEK